MDGREQVFPNTGQSGRKMDAQERARRCIDKNGPIFMRDELADLIRQAEQAAREKALEEAAQHIADKIPRAENDVIRACASLWSEAIRALKERP